MVVDLPGCFTVTGSMDVSKDITPEHTVADERVAVVPTVRAGIFMPWGHHVSHALLTLGRMILNLESTQG